MLTPEEKQAFVSSIINLPTKSLDRLIVQKQLHEQLIKDSNCGKLYKYRYFDSNGYSLKNLEEGTLHCSNASAFNDPFDCKIGATFKSLYAAKYGTEMDLICRLLEKFVLVVRNEISIADCNEDEQRIIKCLMQRERLMQFVNEDYSEISNEEETATFLKANAVIILDLMQTVLADQKLSPVFGVCASMLPRLLAHITEDGMLQLVKDNGSIEDFAAAQGITEDADEIDLTMLLCKKINPELATATEDVQRLISEWDCKIARSTAELFQIGCLCTNPKNRLMWSHYADSHKGFCVEYDFSVPSDDVLSTLPIPVLYSTERPLIPWEPTLDKTSENMEEACKRLLLGLITKDSAWSYENEWRIFINKDEPSDLIMPKISCVYLGVSISDDNRKKILKIAKAKQIPVKQMKIDRGKYALHAEDVIID